MNGFLTPLAIVGIVVFAVVLLLLGVLLVQQALGVIRLVRSARITVRIVSDDADETDDVEALDRPTGADVRKGWGFD